MASKCYSVEPVLRCVKGCSATRTAPVFVGFHCVPAGKSQNSIPFQEVYHGCPIVRLYEDLASPVPSAMGGSASVQATASFDTVIHVVQRVYQKSSAQRREDVLFLM